MYNKMCTQTVKHMSECFIKPSQLPPESKQVIHLATWDLAMLSFHYIQQGLLFEKPTLSDAQGNFMQLFLERLKESLSITLARFYPLAGRLATRKEEDSDSCVLYIDCVNSPGARFVHAAVDVTTLDILSPPYVPTIVYSFFDHQNAVNYDGLNMSLLTLQVTELVDGIFIGCSVNHSVADGTSFWNFFNTLSDVFQAKLQNRYGGEVFARVTSPLIHEPWFPDGYGPFITLPLTRMDQFISRNEAPIILKERIFHFSVAALARIKAKANAHCKDKSIRISNLQALAALIWRCVTRVRGLSEHQITSCNMAANNRSRLVPPLSQNYFGNCMQILKTSTTANELLAHDLTWAALQLNKTITKHDDRAVRDSVAIWLQTPYTYQLRQLIDDGTMMFSNSPRFDMYGNEFGFGKPLACLSGYTNMFSGKVTLYEGREGGGSIDTGICLSANLMAALECDEEFVNALNVIV